MGDEAKTEESRAGGDGGGSAGSGGGGGDAGGGGDGDGGEGPETLVALLDDLDEQVDGDESFAVRDIVETFGSRAFGPLIAAPALIALTPLGAVPGVPTALAVFVVLVSGQHLVGMGTPWLPKALLDRSVSMEKWEKGRDRARPWAARVDRLIKPRLTWLTAGAMDRLASAMAVCIGGMMVPLEVLPFAVLAPAFALVCIGLSLSSRDGVLFLIGTVVACGSGYLVWMALK